MFYVAKTVPLPVSVGSILERLCRDFSLKPGSLKCGVYARTSHLRSDVASLAQAEHTSDRQVALFAKPVVEVARSELQQQYAGYRDRSRYGSGYWRGYQAQPRVQAVERTFPSHRRDVGNAERVDYARTPTASSSRPLLPFSRA